MVLILKKPLLESNKPTLFQGIWLTGHGQLFFKECWEALSYCIPSKTQIDVREREITKYCSSIFI